METQCTVTANDYLLKFAEIIDEKPENMKNILLAGRDMIYCKDKKTAIKIMDEYMKDVGEVASILNMWGAEEEYKKKFEDALTLFNYWLSNSISDPIREKFYWFYRLTAPRILSREIRSNFFRKKQEITVNLNDEEYAAAQAFSSLYRKSMDEVLMDNMVFCAPKKIENSEQALNELLEMVQEYYYSVRYSNQLYGIIEGFWNLTTKVMGIYVPKEKVNKAKIESRFNEVINIKNA